MDRAEPTGFVEEHEVTYEFAPQVERVRGVRLHVGLALQLFARPSRRLPDPGGPVAAQVWLRLRELALAALPPGTPPSAYTVLPFRAAYRLRPETGFAPEVMLGLVLYEPGGGSASGAHPFERETAQVLEERLHALGLQHRVWRTRSH